MSRVLFSRGSRGEIIRGIQGALRLPAPQIDGRYGKITTDAVLAFQQASGILPTGEVDTDSWTALMHVPVPAMRERTLQLTAAFEGHGFGLAQGNFDGAGITWGIIGFTLQGGELGRIVRRIEQEHQGLVRDAFGDLTDQLFQVLAATPAEQTAFANSISLGAMKAVLAEPWLSAFRTLGEKPEVQAIQLDIADKDYFQKALVTAAGFRLQTELGLALAFDIHVQNGGASAAARRQIQDTMAAHPSDREQDLRVAIANAVADNAKNVAVRPDVRSRKLTIATGAGQVHGDTFVLRNWALAELPFGAVV